MARGMIGAASLVVGAMIALGCGSKPAAAPEGASGAPAAASAAASAPASASASASPSASATAAVPAAAASAPTATSAPAAPPPNPHPFAKNAEEATSLIDDAINSKATEITACVDQARQRRNDKHARIVILVGIDENGHVMGVERPKGEKKDKALADCLLAALKDAPFPQSHAGVITVKRTFEDKAVYR